MAKFWIKVWRVRLGYFLSLVVLGLLIFQGYQLASQRMNQQAVATMSWALANKVVVIDPGHGGYDPGKIGVGGTIEKDLNLAIGKKLARIMSNAGALVVMTREEDVDLVTPGEGSKKKRDLDNRLAIVRDVEAEIYIGIQANSFGTRWTGAQTFYNEKNPEGKKLAISIQNEIKRQLRNTNRNANRISDEASYILRNLLHIPATFVEVGFISNPREEKLLNDPVYQEKMAFAIYSGVVKYFVQVAQDTNTTEEAQ